jgi:hypothetical protein
VGKVGKVGKWEVGSGFWNFFFFEFFSWEKILVRDNLQNPLPTSHFPLFTLKEY